MNGPIQSPAPPDLRALLDSFKQEVLTSLNSHLLGKIVTFDATKQTASVQIQSSRMMPDGSTVPYPLLTDCPVQFPSGGGAFLTLPVAAGDSCLVLFHDTDLDSWFATGNVSVPNSVRSHSLSDGLVIPGFSNLSDPIPDFPATSAALRYKGSLLAIDNDGTIRIVSTSGANIVLQPDGTLDMAAVKNLYLIAVDVNKIRISNGIISLKGALDNLCTALAAWVNTGGSTPNPATIAAIVAAKADIDSVLL